MTEVLSAIPNEKWEKFFNTFKDIDTLSVSDWKKSHLIGYFCRKYKETYHIDYAFKFNTPSPVKSFEVWQISSLAGKLSSKPDILKDYIDWCFINVVPKAKKRLTSISFLNKEDTLKFYKMNILWAEQTGFTLDRTTILPANYREILQTIANLSIMTYGDLAFIAQMNPAPTNFEQAMIKMKEIGFDKEVLTRIV